MSWQKVHFLLTFQNCFGVEGSCLRLRKVHFLHRSKKLTETNFTQRNQFRVLLLVPSERRGLGAGGPNRARVGVKRKAHWFSVGLEAGTKRAKRTQMASRQKGRVPVEATWPCKN